MAANPTGRSIVDGIDKLIADMETFGDSQSSQNDASECKLSIDERIELITRNLAEVMENNAVEKMREIMQTRPVRVYWGTATTGAPHIAYFVPLSKLGDFLNAGCHVTVLLADLHAFLDALKTPWELLDHRVNYYTAVIKSMLRAVGVPLERLHFVRGSTFQTKWDYTLDVYKLCAQSTINQGQKAGAEVVKQQKDPKIAPVLYPLLQALDEEYLKVDVQFGGVDQRKIFAFAHDNLGKVGYARRIHLMNPMVPGLTSAKMSASGGASNKIDPVMDTAKDVEKKVAGAFCEPNNIKGSDGESQNGVLAFCEYVLFPILFENAPMVFERPEKYGGNILFKTYQELEDGYGRGDLYPADLKRAVVKYLNSMLDPVRAEFATAEFSGLRALAYPEEAAKMAVASGANQKSKKLTKKERKALKKQKQGKKPKQKQPQQPKQAEIGRLQLVVGKVLTVENHPNPEITKCFVETIDIGEDEPRTIVSGLRGRVSKEDFVGAMVVVVSNLKAAEFKGVLSNGMVLAAANDDGAELLTAPPSAQIGERVVVEGIDMGTADEEMDIKKKSGGKVWRRLLKVLSTDGDCQCTVDGKRMVVASGDCITVKSLQNCPIR